MLDGRCVAVLEIASRPMNQFDDSDRALMTAVAEQLAAALRGVQLRNQSELRAQRLALTASVANAVAAADTVEDVLRAAVDAIFEPTDYGAVTAHPGAARRRLSTWSSPTACGSASRSRARAGRSMPGPPAPRSSAASRSSSDGCAEAAAPTPRSPSSRTSRRS